MRKLGGIGAAVLAATGMWASVALASTFPTFKSRLIVPNASVGGIALHGSYASARRALHGGTGDCNPASGCQFRELDGATLSILFAALAPGSGARVIGITIQAGATLKGGRSVPVFNTSLDRLRTAGGVGLGSTLATLRRAYPQLSGNPGSGLIIKGRTVGTETRFGLLGGRVDQIMMTGVRIG